MLTVQNLSFSYSKKPFIENMDFHVDTGEIFGFLGPSGAGKTIFLTTYNMMDAAELCDRVAFIVNGSIKALDSPHNLIMRKGAAKIKYTYYDGYERTGECLLSVTSEDSIFTNLVKENRIVSVHSSEPTLNDIFMEVTGRTLQ